MTTLLGIQSLDEHNRSILDNIIKERYEAGDNSTQLMEIMYQWEDDTRKHKGIPPRLV